jgi:NhaA family Na+:H+ antiporter
LGGRNLLIYSLLGFIVWADFFFSGIHATVAGVLAAMIIPVRTRIDAQGFLDWSRTLLDWFEQSGAHGRSELISAPQRLAVAELERACEHVETPLHRLENMLHPWVAYLIIPIFAFANAGVALSAETVRNLGSAVGLGILVGLVVGKFIGILTATFLAVQLRLAVLPSHVRWSHIVGVAVLGGMGFTMSLFIAGLAFGGDGHATALAIPAKLASPAFFDASLDRAMHDVAKLAILLASLIAGFLGSLLLLRVPVLSEADAANEE